MQAIVLSLAPNLELYETSSLPELLSSEGRILEALLNLDAFVGLDRVIENLCLFGRREERLVASTLGIINIFPNDFPVVDIESWFAKHVVGMCKTVFDKLVSDSMLI